ncbi:hypothetical protein N8697_01575 [bacterium]|nr:hypothetical protein [bacterium]
MNTKGQHISRQDRKPEAEAKFGRTRISIGQPAGTTDLTAHLGGTASTANQLTRSASPAPRPQPTPRLTGDSRG